MSVLQVLWMSTHGCSAILFPIYLWWYIRRWSPGARCHRRRLLPGGSRRHVLLGWSSRPGVGSEALGRRPSPFRSRVIVCASLLKANLTNYVCTQILFVCMTYVFGSSWPLVCNMRFMFKFEFRVVLWYLPVSPWAWSCTFACMISARLSPGPHKLVSEPTAYRKPPSNSLVEVESRHKKSLIY